MSENGVYTQIATVVANMIYQPLDFDDFGRFPNIIQTNPPAAQITPLPVLLGLVSLAEAEIGGCGTAPQVVRFINLWSSDKRRDPSPPPFEDLAA